MSSSYPPPTNAATGTPPPTQTSSTSASRRMSPSSVIDKPQFVGFVHVHAGVVQHEVRLEILQRFPQRALYRFYVRLIPRSFRQRNVAVAPRFVRGEVLGAVHGEREDARVVARYSRRAVALVHVEVQNEDAVRGFPLNHPLRGDRQVVEDAVAAAVVEVRVVRARRSSRRRPSRAPNPR